MKEWERDLQVAHWTGEGHRRLPRGSTGDKGWLLAREKAEPNDERQEDFLCQAGCSICPESTAEYSTKCAVMFLWFRLLCLTVPLVLGITSQWLSVHNVGVINYKLQKPDINLALLGLSSQNLPCLKFFEGWRKKWTAGSVKCRSGGLMCSGMFTRSHWFCSGLISVIEVGDLYSLV